MKWRNLKIGNKLGASFGAVLVLLSIVALQSVLGIGLKQRVGRYPYDAITRRQRDRNRNR